MKARITQNPFSFLTTVRTDTVIDSITGKPRTTAGTASQYGPQMAEYSDRVEPNGTRYPTRWAARVIVTGRGQEVGGRYDYLPFGEEVYEGRQGYGGDQVRQRFTGYERDDEIGLDFAKARYYSYTQGRFTSPDPLLSSGKASRPQTWNRYSYCLNNPLRYVDKNGEWPTETHNKIIRQAFPGLSARQREKMQQGSASVDRDLRKPIKLATENTEVERLAYRHAMTPGSKVDELKSESAARDWAKTEASKFISGNMTEASNMYANSHSRGDHVPDGALEAFGRGAHTIMDGSSPAHNDFQVFRLVQVVP